MNRVIRGTVVLAAALGAISCKGDPTGDLRNGVDHLIATPSALYIDNAGTENVVVEAVDEQGNRVASSFQLGTVGAGITVARDNSYNQVYDKNGNLVQPSTPTRVQYNVTADLYTASQFVVSAGGKSITIPVRTTPATLDTPLSTTTPNIGDTVTVTAPAGLEFDPANSEVTIGGTAAAIISRSATAISFVPAPGSTGPVSVSEVTPTYAPVGPFEVPTNESITVPPLPAFTFTPTTAGAVGDTITVTAPGAFRFSPTSAPTISGASVVNLGPSTDSLTLKFLIGPNADTSFSVSNMVVSGAPALGNFTLKSDPVFVNSPVVSNFVATISDATPAFNTPAVLTAGAGFKFLPGATVTVNGIDAPVVARAADSSSISFLLYPVGGAAAAPVVNGVAFSTLTALSLTLPATVTVTAPSSGFTGADDFATAPVLTIPPSGQTNIYVDEGTMYPIAACNNDLGGDCRAYQFTLGATTTFHITITWQGTTDIGGYFYDSGGNVVDGCDGLGNDTDGQPESCDITLPADTYTLVLDDFGPFYSPPEAPPQYLRMDFTTP
jgi:hypothetical protein